MFTVKSPSQVLLLALALVSLVFKAGGGGACITIDVIMTKGGHPNANEPVVALTSCWCGAEHKRRTDKMMLVAHTVSPVR